MRNQHRLCALQMGVGGHGRISRLFCAVEQNAQPIRQIGTNLINGGPHIEAKVGRNLLIAASAAVQLVPGIAHQPDQLLFDKVMHIFRLGIFQKSRRRCGSP